MLSENRDSLSLYFLPLCLNFTFLPLLHLLGLLVQHWIGVVRVNIIFVPDFRRNNLLPVNILLVVGFLWVSFIRLKKFPSILGWLRIFIMFFSVLMDMIIWLFFFWWFIWWIRVIDFQILNQPCISEIDPTWS